MTLLTIIITVYIVIKILFFIALVYWTKNPKKEPKHLFVNKFDVDMIWGKTHIFGEKTSEHNFKLTFDNANSNS